MASRSESGMTPGTSFAGTLPANGLTPCVPGMGWPGAEVASVWASEVAAPQNKTPASKNVETSPYPSFKGASLASHLAKRRCRGKYPSPVGSSEQLASSDKQLRPTRDRSKLLEVSARAQERMRLRDEGYALMTAQKPL